MLAPSDKILIIDDDAAVATAFLARLRRFGYDVSWAEDGEKGLEQCHLLKPAVILLDLRMPNMDGHTFLRRFATQGLDSVVVVTSADGDMDDVISVMRNGAVDYLKKPWTTSELAALMTRAMLIHAQRRGAPAPLAGVASSGLEPSSDFAKTLERLRQGEIVIPSIPTVVVELRKLLDVPTCPVDKIAAVLERDQRLLASILRLGSSARYGGLAKTANLRAVLARIGFREIRDLVEATWINNCFTVKDPRYHRQLVRIWRHSVARAIAMRALANASNLDGGPAYLAGLFADVGACVLLWIGAEKGSGGPLPDPESILPTIRLHHVKIGADLLRSWGYSNPLVDNVVQSHHVVAAATSDRYASAFVVATDIVRTLGTAVDITDDTSGPTADLVDRCRQELGLSEAALDQMVDRLEPEIAAVLAAVE